jgi:hypothetical protein
MFGREVVMRIFFLPSAVGLIALARAVEPPSRPTT